MAKLNALKIQSLCKAGRFNDGHGLYLQISNSGTKSWIFRFMLHGKSREMGLGSLNTLTLGEARLRALDCRKALLNGQDPIEQRQIQRNQIALEAAKNITFDQCAAAYVESHQVGWKNKKHIDQWRNSLATYAKPFIGHLPVQLIDTSLVMKVLEPIWIKKPETASRVRNRLEIILGWATVRGHRSGENPARWRHHLDMLLPKRSSFQKVKHFAAIPVNEAGEFLVKLRQRDGIAPLALEFLILTVLRTSEVLGAKWCEIDFNARRWVVPAERMKAKREHRVPLSPRAIEILETLKKTNESEFVFPGRKYGSPLSNMALLCVIRAMNYKITSHGFRSTFRDWAAERTNYPREVAEAALAHVVKDKVEAAYMRSDLFMKRIKMMNDWEKFCLTRSSDVASISEIKGKSA